MNFKHLILGCFVASNFLCVAQQKKEVLFTVDNKPYYTDEFLRIYNKNIDLVKDETQKDLNQYLELFIGYKLKVNKAFKLGLDNNENYLTELKSNRTQLAKNYLTDSKVTQELIDEAYSRLQKEIRASHILILVDENAPAIDTLAALSKAIDIRKRALAGEDFEKLAQENSMDTSAKENKGDLGYFSAFRMVYPFESGAYSTKKGEISNPIRTRFGYHLIKTTDIRDNRGEMIAAHIMIMKPTDASKEAEAKAKINDIYKKIQQGENFENLAKEFSEDKSSSENGGSLNRFSSGQLSSNEFEDAAFSLTQENPLSAPFQSQYGWHIVKFKERFPVKSASDMQQELSAKISKDERSRKISNSVTEKLRKEYPSKRNDKLFDMALKSVNSDYITETWTVPQDKIFEGTIESIKDKQISAKTFLNYLFEQQKSYKDSKLSIENIVNTTYEKFLNEQLNKYADENLENKFPEFANVMEEYKDGLLLFDLMEKEIWEKSKTDTLGLESFYDKNKQKYQWNKRYDVLVVSSTKKDYIKKAQKMLKKGKSAAEIKEALNSGKEIEVIEKEGLFEEGSTLLPKNIQDKKGLTAITQEGDYYFISRVKDIIPAGQKTFKECEGKVINDYQQYLEENWVSDLKKEFTIKVNTEVFEQVKAEIKS
jgi:peptidyl-prolyl cis-trans isomerase SurA